MDNQSKSLSSCAPNSITICFLMVVCGYSKGYRLLSLIVHHKGSARTVKQATNVLASPFLLELFQLSKPLFPWPKILDPRVTFPSQIWIGWVVKIWQNIEIFEIKWEAVENKIFKSRLCHLGLEKTIKRFGLSDTIIYSSKRFKST